MLPRKDVVAVSITWTCPTTTTTAPPPTMVAVPNVVGLELGAGIQQLQGLGFVVTGLSPVPRIGCSNGFAPVYVASQSPSGGQLAVGSTVTITDSGYRCQ